MWNALNTGAISSYWTPAAVINDVHVWHDAADVSTVTLETGVKQWNDKSTNNINVVQSNTGKQPVYNLNPLNGMPTITTDGVDDELHINNTDLFTTSDHSYIILAKVLSVSHENDSIVSYNGGTGDWQLNSGNASQFNGVLNNSNAGSSAVSFGQTNVTDWALWGFDSIPNTNLITYFNGVQQNNDANFTSWDLTSIDYRFGIRRTSLVFCHCAIAEAIMITRPYRQIAEGYLAWKRGRVDLLSAGHPYKNVRP